METTSLANILDGKLVSNHILNGVRISNFGYSVSQKIGLTSELQSKLTGRKSEYDEHYQKHISDMKEMIIKFNSLKWKQPA